MAPTGQQCPHNSGSMYMPDEGLEEIPDIPDIDFCSRLDFSHNQIGTLINSHCQRCDYLDFSNNNLTELTAEMMNGFRNAKHVRLNQNMVRKVEGEAIEGLARLDLNQNPLSHFPWNYTLDGQEFSLDANLLHCTCDMKNAIDRKVVILGELQCIDHPGIGYREVLNTMECVPDPQNVTTATGTLDYHLVFPEVLCLLGNV